MYSPEHKCPLKCEETPSLMFCWISFRSFNNFSMQTLIVVKIIHLTSLVDAIFRFYYRNYVQDMQSKILNLLRTSVVRISFIEFLYQSRYHIWKWVNGKSFYSHRMIWILEELALIALEDGEKFSSCGLNYQFHF